MDRPLELGDFEYIGDDWHFDAPIRGYILPTSKGGQGPDKILVIDASSYVLTKKIFDKKQIIYFVDSIKSYLILST